jgi:hypothetical protein
MTVGRFWTSRDHGFTRFHAGTLDVLVKREQKEHMEMSLFKP